MLLEETKLMNGLVSLPELTNEVNLPSIALANGGAINLPAANPKTFEAASPTAPNAPLIAVSTAILTGDSCVRLEEKANDRHNDAAKYQPVDPLHGPG